MFDPPIRLVGTGGYAVQGQVLRVPVARRAHVPHRDVRQVRPPCFPFTAFTTTRYSSYVRSIPFLCKNIPVSLSCLCAVSLQLVTLQCLSVPSDLVNFNFHAGLLKKLPQPVTILIIL